MKACLDLNKNKTDLGQNSDIVINYIIVERLKKILIHVFTLLSTNVVNLLVLKRSLCHIELLFVANI